MTEHIKINDVDPRIQYEGDGATVEFPFPFPLFAAGDVAVYLDDTPQGAGYTVLGAGVTAGGSVIFDTAPADGVLVTLVRALTIERTTDFQTSGAFLADVINDALDYLTAVCQDLAYGLGLKIGVSAVEGEALAELPSAAERADKLLGFDSDGKPTVATVGNAQTTPPQFFEIDAGTADYPLTLPDGVSVAADDLLIDIDGWDLHQNSDFTVTGGDTVHLLIDLTERDGYEMQVRVISYALAFGAVPDGSVNSPDKFDGRPVDLAALAPGTALGVLGYDAAGLPAVLTRKYVGEVWWWGGDASALPAGNVVYAGQTLAEADFPALFAAWGLTGAGTVVLPSPAGRTLLAAGQGNTAEGGLLGTARLIRTTGGAEQHTQTVAEMPAHTHGLSLVGTNTTATGQRVNNGGTDTQTGSAGSGDPMNLMNPFLVAGYLAVHTGQANHDYLGVIP